MANIKKEMIRFFKKLDGVVPEKQKKINDVISLLEKKNPKNPREDYANIPENEEGKREACEYIRFVFCKNPELMTPINKKLIEKFSENIDLPLKPSKRPRR
jgi:hypothetical protein